MAKVMEWIDAWLPTDLAWRIQPFPIRLEEIREDGMLRLRMEVPGVDPAKDIDIVVDDGTLTVSGHRSESEQAAERSEFSYGAFTRVVALPRGVDEESVKACYRGGILEITMPWAQTPSTPRHVPIDGGDTSP